MSTTVIGDKPRPVPITYILVYLQFTKYSTSYGDITTERVYENTVDTAIKEMERMLDDNRNLVILDKRTREHHMERLLAGTV